MVTLPLALLAVGLVALACALLLALDALLVAELTHVTPERKR